MERLDARTAKVAVSGSGSASPRPSEQDKKRWEWLPRSIDPNRAFHLSVTDVRTRSDTHLAAGEDLIAFGTGFPGESPI